MAQTVDGSGFDTPSGVAQFTSVTAGIGSVKQPLLERRVCSCVRDAGVRLGAVALGLCVAGACSSTPTVGRGSAPKPVVSPAPSTAAGLSPAALRRLHWMALPADPLAPRDAAITVWTGDELLVVGGLRSTDGAAYNSADAYDPQTRQWELLPSLPLTPRDGAANAWTSYGLVVWGGASAPGNGRGLSQALGDGAILDPAQRHWTVMPAGPLPALASPIAVTDSADHVIILGGLEAAASAGNTPVSRRAVSYDPAHRTWRSLPDVPAVNGHDLVRLTATRWGSRILVAATWQHLVHPAPGATQGNGGVDLFLLDPAKERWSRFQPVSTAALIGADLRPLGPFLAIAGGTSCPPFAACPFQLNAKFGLVNAQGRALSAVSGPPIQLRAETVIGDSYVVMTGSEITGPGRDEQPGDLAAFDLATRKWITLPSARRYRPQPESLTWTGRELIALSPDRVITLGPN